MCHHDLEGRPLGLSSYSYFSLKVTTVVLLLFRFSDCTDLWVKDIKMSTSKDIYKSDFMSTQSTINVSKVSTFKVSNKFLENKMSKCG